MLESFRRDDPSFRSSCEEPHLHQVRFINVLYRALFFRDGRGDGLKAGRAAVEIIDDGQQDLPVCFLESLIIYLRSEEHTSELQSQSNLVCRLLLEKKK